MSTKPRTLLRLEYEKAAQDYLRSLPQEHFMEAVAQATQRKITLESLDLVHAQRQDVQVFNELLVQYPIGTPPEIHQVVPDNMVVVSDEPVEADGSFDFPLQPVGPFWVLEYVSKSSKRKDYEDSFHKYENELKVRYYLLFYPENQELTLFRHTGKKYVTVKPNKAGRFAIPHLELEMALLDGWVRYWYQGKLLPLPADLQRELDETRRQLDESRRQLDESHRQLDETRQQLGEAQRQAEAERRQRERLLAQLRALGINPAE
jgi:Uma2 family endonuclease